MENYRTHFSIVDKLNQFLVEFKTRYRNVALRPKGPGIWLKGATEFVSYTFAPLLGQ